MNERYPAFYLIRTVSNLHAGAGDASFGLIDKIVQRDVVTELPTIFASSIKGAVRQLFSANKLAGEEEIFGSDNRLGSESELKQGSYIFHDAKLLSIPIRSNHQLFYLATTPPLLGDFLADLSRYRLASESVDLLKTISKLTIERGKPRYIGEMLSAGKLYLEHQEATHYAVNDYANLEPLLGPRIALLNVEDFAEHCEELPTVARNSLENGISVNLWYEEIVPRETRFYCTVVREEEEDRLNAAIAEHFNGLVQIGANATVGQGLCKWSPIGGLTSIHPSKNLN